MKPQFRWLVVAATVAIAGSSLTGCSDSNAQENPPAAAPTSTTIPNAALPAPSAMETIASWPADSKMVGQQMIEKYGEPSEMTPTMLIWLNNGMWKKTVVFRDSVPHEFPGPHTDLLQQFIDYRLEPEQFSRVALYDGSVIAERTKGELSARCDKEEFNILAINLAVEVANGKRSIQNARAFYAQNVMDVKAGKKTPYTSELQFVRPSGATNDPDMPFGD